MTADLGADRLRAAALDAWANHPVRFREDANSEEDHARGWYRDRVVVELAQNAADAAARAGVPGRLDLTLTGRAHGGTLVVANTGTPLDAAGLASLASLRASAKRDGSQVGRFGVGFAAVRSVSDEITVASTSGTVHFGVEDAAALVADVATGQPELAAEATRRGRWIPVLRLPLPGPAPGHAGHLAGVGSWADTVVVLTLRDADAVASVRDQLALDDTVLLALPALSRVQVTIDDEPTRVVADVAERWVVATESGTVDPAQLHDRPIEERDRTGWQVTWAVRRDGEAVPGVVHAPTPTDEPCTVPALLIGTFPLDATRRHVAEARITGTLVSAAGRAWSALLSACREDPSAPDPLDLVPIGVPAGRLDARVRDVVVTATRTTAILSPAAGGPAIAPSEAVALTGPGSGDLAVTRLLGRWWPGLVLPPRSQQVLRVLGVEPAELSELVGGLPDLGPAAVRELYEAFATADAGTLEHLATVPVPLVDGRTVRGARGLVLLDGDVDPALLRPVARWGVRVVHPDARHGLLERLGAEQRDLAGLAGHAALRAALDDDAPVLLALVRAALEVGPVTPRPWWGDAVLTSADGQAAPARELCLPGSPAAAVLDSTVVPPVHADVVDRWGREVLVAVGVRNDLVVVDATTEEPEGWADYLDEHGVDGHGVDGHGVDGPGDVARVVADLDAVRSEAWPVVLARLAADHRDVLAPIRARAEGPAVPAYTAWWIRTRAGLGLDAPFAVTGADRVADVLPAAPTVVAGLDEQVQRWLGGVGDLAELDADGWAAVLESLDGDVAPHVAAAAWRSLLDGVRAGQEDWADLPELPALVGQGRFAVVATDDAAVGDPMWAQLAGVRPVLVVPAGAVDELAHALELPVARERAPGRVTSAGGRAPTPSAVRAVFPDAPHTWVEHEDLAVDGVAVDWWVDDDVHAATTHGLALGLAARVGWAQAGRIARLLAGADPAEVLLEVAGDDA